MVGAALGRDEAIATLIMHESKHLSRNAEAHFQLGTDGDPLDESSERLNQEGIPFVPAVESNLLPEQA